MRNLSPPSLPCMCASFRRASRVLSQRYDEAMRPLGFTIAQFTILQALSLTGEVRQARLGEILAIDSTTLTRTLELMVRRGWIVKRFGKDRRERFIGPSKLGKREFDRALPAWQKVQEQLRTQMGEKRWKTLFNLTTDVTAMAT